MPNSRRQGTTAKTTRGQGTFEYVLLLGGVLLIVVLALVVLQGNFFQTASGISDVQMKQCKAAAQQATACYDQVTVFNGSKPFDMLGYSANPLLCNCSDYNPDAFTVSVGQKSQTQQNFDSQKPNQQKPGSPDSSFLYSTLNFDTPLTPPASLRYSNLYFDTPTPTPATYAISITLPKGNYTFFLVKADGSVSLIQPDAVSETSDDRQTYSWNALPTGSKIKVNPSKALNAAQQENAKNKDQTPSADEQEKTATQTIPKTIDSDNALKLLKTTDGKNTAIFTHTPTQDYNGQLTLTIPIALEKIEKIFPATTQISPNSETPTATDLTWNHIQLHAGIAFRIIIQYKPEQNDLQRLSDETDDNLQKLKGKNLAKTGNTGATNCPTLFGITLPIGCAGPATTNPTPTLSTNPASSTTPSPTSQCPTLPFSTIQIPFGCVTPSPNPTAGTSTGPTPVPTSQCPVIPFLEITIPIGCVTPSPTPVPTLSPTPSNLPKPTVDISNFQIEETQPWTWLDTNDLEVPTPTPEPKIAILSEAPKCAGENRVPSDAGCCLGLVLLKEDEFFPNSRTLCQKPKDAITTQPDSADPTTNTAAELEGTPIDSDALATATPSMKGFVVSSGGFVKDNNGDLFLAYQQMQEYDQTNTEAYGKITTLNPHRVVTQVAAFDDTNNRWNMVGKPVLPGNDHGETIMAPIDYSKCPAKDQGITVRTAFGNANTFYFGLGTAVNIGSFISGYLDYGPVVSKSTLTQTMTSGESIQESLTNSQTISYTLSAEDKMILEPKDSLTGVTTYKEGCYTRIGPFQISPKSRDIGFSYTQSSMQFNGMMPAFDDGVYMLYTLKSKTTDSTKYTCAIQSDVHLIHARKEAEKAKDAKIDTTVSNCALSNWVDKSLKFVGNTGKNLFFTENDKLFNYTDTGSDLSDLRQTWTQSGPVGLLKYPTNPESSSNPLENMDKYLQLSNGYILGVKGNQIYKLDTGKWVKLTSYSMAPWDWIGDEEGNLHVTTNYYDSLLKKYEIGYRMISAATINPALKPQINGVYLFTQDNCDACNKLKAWMEDSKVIYQKDPANQGGPIGDAIQNAAYAKKYPFTIIDSNQNGVSVLQVIIGNDPLRVAEILGINYDAYPAFAPSGGVGNLMRLYTADGTPWVFVQNSSGALDQFTYDKGTWIRKPIRTDPAPSRASVPLTDPVIQPTGLQSPLGMVSEGQPAQSLKDVVYLETTGFANGAKLLSKDNSASAMNIDINTRINKYSVYPLLESLPDEPMGGASLNELVPYQKVVLPIPLDAIKTPSITIKSNFNDGIATKVLPSDDTPHAYQAELAIDARNYLKGGKLDLPIDSVKGLAIARTKVKQVKMPFKVPVQHVAPENLAYITPENLVFYTNKGKGVTKPVLLTNNYNRPVTMSCGSLISRVLIPGTITQVDITPPTQTTECTLSLDGVPTRQVFRAEIRPVEDGSPWIEEDGLSESMETNEDASFRDCADRYCNCEQARQATDDFASLVSSHVSRINGGSPRASVKELYPEGYTASTVLRTDTFDDLDEPLSTCSVKFNGYPFELKPGSVYQVGFKVPQNGGWLSWDGAVPTKPTELLKQWSYATTNGISSNQDGFQGATS